MSADWTNRELAIACDEVSSEAMRSAHALPLTNSTTYAWFVSDASKFTEAARRLRACKCQSVTEVQDAPPLKHTVGDFLSSM